MKKRSQLIILSVLIFVVIFVVLSSSIFSFSEMGVDYLTTTINLNLSQEEIFNASKLEFGKSIFFVDKSSAVKNVEKSNPYIKVVNIETVFPNKLIFHVAERQELFAVKYENKYLILDDEGKVLKIKDNFINTAENAILLDNYDVNKTASQNDINTKSQIFHEYKEGEFVVNKEGLISLAKTLKEWKTSYVHLRAHIISISTIGEDLFINMRCGLTIKVFHSSVDLSNKINLAFSIYDKAEDVENKTLLEIRSVKNQNGNYELKGFIS